MEKQQHRTLMRVPKGMQLPLQAPSPEEGYPFWRRRRVGPGETVLVQALSQNVFTYFCHCVHKLFFPCFSDLGADCPHHGEHSPRRIWQGTIPCWDRVAKEIQLLTLSKGALDHCKPLRDRSDLAGLTIRAGRRSGGKNAPMYAAITDDARLDLSEDKIVSKEQFWAVQLNIWGVVLVEGG